MKKIITVAAIATLATVGFAGTASAADYTSPNAVPGHEKTEKQGKVVTHYTQESDGCDYVVNTLGDFGGDAYLNNGQMMNRISCDDGSVVTYHIFHKSHPAYDADRMEPIWGSWGYFETVNKAGRS